MVKVDLTQKGNPVQARLLSQYGVKGVLPWSSWTAMETSARTCV